MRSFAEAKWGGTARSIAASKRGEHGEGVLSVKQGGARRGCLNDQSGGGGTTTGVLSAAAPCAAAIVVVIVSSRHRTRADMKFEAWPRRRDTPRRKC